MAQQQPAAGETNNGSGSMKEIRFRGVRKRPWVSSLRRLEIHGRRLGFGSVLLIRRMVLLELTMPPPGVSVEIKHEVTHRVILDVDIDKQRVGRIVVGLYGEVVPKTTGGEVFGIFQDCTDGLLYALLPVLGGNSGILQGKVSTGRVIGALMMSL